jgi:ABC-type bacteriocin/lantibiotic exporter with double-glycine peptidase domain
MIHHPLPIILQTRDYDCGPACVESVVSYCGWTVNADTLLRATRAHPRHGTDAADLVPILDAAGTRPTVDDELCRDELCEHVERHGPAICPIRAYQDGHWVAVVGFTDCRVIVMDPASDVRAFRSLTWAQWMKRWWDLDRDNHPIRRQAVLCRVRRRPGRVVVGVPG